MNHFQKAKQIVHWITFSSKFTLPFFCTCELILYAFIYLSTTISFCLIGLMSYCYNIMSLVTCLYFFKLQTMFIIFRTCCKKHDQNLKQHNFLKTLNFYQNPNILLFVTDFWKRNMFWTFKQIYEIFFQPQTLFWTFEYFTKTIIYFKNTIFFKIPVV